MFSKGLTLSIVFKAASANYGESFGNISELKKLTRGNGESYTYISRQALRYNMIQQLGWDNTPVSAEGSGAKKVVQFSSEATIDNYPEIDLFGYMKTIDKNKSKGKKATQNEDVDDEAKGGAITRSSVVRLSHAVSLEPFASDLDFQTNMGLSSRLEGVNNNIAQSEQHLSYYSYTITIDLERVGIDENYKDIVISCSEKSRRVNALLDTVQFLYRDIKGRRENLAPLFIIGGVYQRKNPYFLNRVVINKNKIDIKSLIDVINSCDDTQKNTITGIASGIFKNEDKILDELKAISIGDFFREVKEKVEGFYNESC
jgi:CRISPR-associated protein Cst2